MATGGNDEDLCFDYGIVRFACVVYEKDILEALKDVNFEEVINNIPDVELTEEERNFLKYTNSEDSAQSGKAIKKYWKKHFMAKNKENKMVYQSLWDYAVERNQRLMKILQLDLETANERKQRDVWKRVIRKDKNIYAVDVRHSDILDNLQLLKTIPTPVKDSIANKARYEGPERAMYTLIDEISKYHTNWFVHLLLVLHQNDHDVALTLEPRMGEVESQLLKDMELTEGEQLISDLLKRPIPEESASAEEEHVTEADSQQTGDSPRIINDLNVMASFGGRDSPDGSETIDSNDFRSSAPTNVSRELVLREYQKQLARPGVEGKNNIVFAPTGSGKTIVAVQIAKEHMRSATAKKKIAFLVPTKPLADQQAAIFKQYLGCTHRVRDLIGGDGNSVPLPLSEIMKEYDIIVMTAQVLVNALKDEFYKLESIREFSLIIFDECHHCDKGHPYNEIMISYFNEREAGETDLPQIIGLTASFGTGKAGKFETAYEHVMAMCARLDSTAPPQVVEIRPEDYWQLDDSFDEIVECHPKQRDYAGDCLELLMGKIEKKLREICSHPMEVLGGLKDVKIPQKRGSTTYTSFVNGELKQILVNLKDCEKIQMMKTAIRYLDKYNRALILSRLMRSKDANEYIQRELMTLKPQTDFEANLVNTFRANFPDEFGASDEEQNPALYELKERIVSQFKRESRSRVIIFVKERDYTTALCDWFNDELPHFVVEVVVGAQASADRGGQTQNQQKTILNNFREGRTNILVCTSVVEEGLDVPECNMVIRYGYVTNETAMIQSKGRGRTADAKYILIVPCGEEWLARKEKLNIFRKSLMVKATQHVTTLAEGQYRSCIQAIQKEEGQMRYLKKETQKLKENAKRGKRYRLDCLNCHVVACSSDDIRVAEGAHHLVICDEILQKILVVKDETKNFSTTKIGGPVLCAACHAQWGNVTYYREVAFPSVAIKNFFLVPEQEGQPKVLKKRWKQSPFGVDAITMREISEAFQRRRNEWAETFVNTEEL